jgi:hypothetical protein
VTLNGPWGGLWVSQVVHLMSLKVNLGYVIDNLVSLLSAAEEPLQTRLRLTGRLWLLLLLIQFLSIERAWLTLLMWRNELLLGLSFDLLRDRRGRLFTVFHLFMRL